MVMEVAHVLNTDFNYETINKNLRSMMVTMPVALLSYGAYMHIPQKIAATIYAKKGYARGLIAYKGANITIIGAGILLETLVLYYHNKKIEKADAKEVNLAAYESSVKPPERCHTKA